MLPPPSVGALLRALEVAERAQEDGRFLADSVHLDGSDLLCRLGDRHYRLQRGMRPDDIVAAARRAGIPAEPVPEGFADGLGVEDPAPLWSAWAQLHYDLGVSEQELRVTAPHLWFVSISLRGAAAEVAITDGDSVGTEIVPLGTNVLQALPVELAFHFHGRDAAMAFRPLAG